MKTDVEKTPILRLSFLIVGTVCMISTFISYGINTGRLQMNGAVSKVNKKFISHLTRAKLIPSAAATV